MAAGWQFVQVPNNPPPITLKNHREFKARRIFASKPHLNGILQDLELWISVVVVVGQVPAQFYNSHTPPVQSPHDTYSVDFFPFPSSFRDLLFTYTYIYIYIYHFFFSFLIVSTDVHVVFMYILFFSFPISRTLRTLCLLRSVCCGVGVVSYR